jgi:GntR family transcriptional regulator
MLHSRPLKRIASAVRTEASLASDRTLAAFRLQTRPLYLQLRDMLLKRIASGEWKPRAVIPNENDLAREYQLSTGTVRKALDFLEAERVLTRKHGHGTFVTDQTADEFVWRFNRIRAADRAVIGRDVQTIEAMEASANAAERGRLDLDADGRVFRIRRLRLYDARPFLVETVSLPATLFPGLLEAGIDYRIVVLAQRCGIPLGKATERISIHSVPPEIAQILAIAPNTPVLLLDRLVLTLDGRPAEWRVAHCQLLEGWFYHAEMG